LEVEL
jgi:hypothetical protein